MVNLLTLATQPKYWAVMVSGGIKASALIGLDAMARAQMSTAFYFDDDLPGAHDFPWRRFQTKTANYSATYADNITQFNNAGASGEVDITLPAIQNGLYFGFNGQTSNVLKAISNEGGNVIGSTLTQTNVSVTAIGGGFEMFTNPGATKWIVVNNSSYNQVVSFS
jgi:hypothetical protein